jgi:hypothetical protein
MPPTTAPPLRHEHIVRINDPANLAGRWLSRAQLWGGLRHTMEAPQELDESIDSAHVREISPRTLRREIRRGNQVTADEVELTPNESIQVRADATGEFAGSTLTIRIEEPAPEMFFVRFTYELYGLAAVRDEEEDSARCSAYQNANIDRIRAARRFALRSDTSIQ